jgi:hypothetical protein
MLRDLAPATRARFVSGALGGLALPAIALLSGTRFPALAIAMFALLLCGELCERYLFFKAAPPSRMPGGLS